MPRKRKKSSLNLNDKPRGNINNVNKITNQTQTVSISQKVSFDHFGQTNQPKQYFILKY